MATLTTNSLAARRVEMPGLGRAIWEYFALGRQRRVLASLDNARLADIGLTRVEAEKEAAKPLWDVPDHWKR